MTYSVVNYKVNVQTKARKLVEELTDDGGEKDDKDNSSNVNPK